MFFPKTGNSEYIQSFYLYEKILNLYIVFIQGINIHYTYYNYIQIYNRMMLINNSSKCQFLRVLSPYITLKFIFLVENNLSSCLIKFDYGLDFGKYPKDKAFLFQMKFIVIGS